MSGAEAVRWVTAWQSGGLGLEVLHHALLRGEALPEGMDLEKFQQDIEETGPGAMFMNGADDDDDLETVQ